MKFTAFLRNRLNKLNLQGKVSYVMHAHAQILNLRLKPMSLERQDSGLFHSSVHYRDEKQNKSRHSCQLTLIPDAYYIQWQEVGGARDPQRRSHQNFLLNSEKVGRFHSLFYQSLVELAASKSI